MLSAFSDCVFLACVVDFDVWRRRQGHVLGSVSYPQGLSFPQVLKPCLYSYDRLLLAWATPQVVGEGMMN
jgi:hypothetical protein